MISNVKIFLSAVKVSFASEMAYRADFFISMFAMVIIEFIFPMVSILIYSQGAFFPDWNLNQMLLLQGVYVTSRGIVLPFFVGMFFTVASSVRQGSFDVILIKPKSPLFISIISYINVHDCSKLLCGFALIALSLAGIGMPGPLEWLSFLVLMMASMLVHFSCIVAFSATAFKWIGVWRCLEIYDTLSLPGLYPRTVFPKYVGYVLTYLFPAAVMAFFPASALLGRFTLEMLLAVAVSLLFLGSSLLFWRSSIKKHTSAGG